MVSYVLGRVLTLLELALALRLTIKYLGGNIQTPVVSFTYKITEPLVVPFNQIFPAISWPKERPLDMTTLSEIIGYAILFFIIVQELRLLHKE